MPSLSVVVLTWNEQANIGACLEALARQTRTDLEVVVVDAASTDRTADIVRAMQADFPFPLRLDIAATRISVGAARNRGVRLAEAPNVAFLSADTEPRQRWAEEALRQLERFDLVYGMQVHSPRQDGRPAAGVGAAVRGLRYHFPSGATGDPATYASHVNAAIRKEVLETFPIGTSKGASAVDDVLLVRRATRAGYRAMYEPRMAVLHRDVDSWRAELRKNHREGLGLGEHAAELGVQKPVLAWGGILVAAGAFVALRPGPLSIGTAAVAVWLPALRRAAKRARRMPPGRLLLGLAASPLFDLAFLLAYVRGILRPAPPAPSAGPPAPGARRRTEQAAPGQEVTP